MEEVCGFVDSKGNFFKTEKECELAEIYIKIEKTKRFLDRFEGNVEEYLFRGTIEDNVDFMRCKNQILDRVSRLVLLCSDDFIEVINEKKKLSEYLEVLEKEYNNNSKPWWLRVKWWR